MNAVPYFMTKNWRKVIYFTRNEIIERGKILAKYNAPGDQGVFSNNPVDGDLNLKSEKVDEEYAICVGSNRRDFTSVINAFDGLGLKLVIRKPPQTPLNFEGDLPSYCEVGHRPKQEYLQEVKRKGIFYLIWNFIKTRRKFKLLKIYQKFTDKIRFSNALIYWYNYTLT